MNLCLILKSEQYKTPGHRPRIQLSKSICLKATILKFERLISDLQAKYPKVKLMRFDWRTYFEDLCQDHNNSRLKQVGKTIDGKEVSWAQIDLIVVHLKNSLKFEKTHRVVDLGCGNGLICEALSPMVHSIDGYDFSPSLIKKANSAKRQSNIQYNVVDLCKIPSECFKSKDIYLLYEVIQHLTVDELHNLFLSISSSASTGARIFMGGIPEKKRLLNFYNTREKYNYFLECEKSQQQRPPPSRLIE